MRTGKQIVLAIAAELALAAVCPSSDDGPARAGDQTVAGGDKRITLQTANTPIADALRLVAEQGGLNLVVGSGVEGEVSVYLENVAVETALRAIAVNNGFMFTVENGLISVARPPEKGDDSNNAAPPLETRVFTLQWQDAERVKDALEFALSAYGKMKVLNENSQTGYGGTKLAQLSGDFESTNSTMYAANTSTATAMPGQITGASIGVETPRNSRTLVVTDTNENLRLIADLIADLDRVPPQVLIEARIVEMSTDLQRELGIDWDMNILANGPILNHELPLDWRAGFAPGTQIRYSRTGNPNTATGLALGTIDFSRFTALMRAHQSNNAIRLLANPRLLVFNNHSASILVGERYPILEANITDQGTLTEAFDTYIPVGIQLEVTPTILADGRISMLVHPTTSALGDDVIGTTGLHVRRILTREIDTRVLLQEGQTVVLGGLISDRKVRMINETPGLGEIPILDVLFRQENPASQRVDLMVFLTAQIEGATQINERDRSIFEMYKPHFKHVERLQDVPLHFEIPTEFEPAKPMFADPPTGRVEQEASPEPKPPGPQESEAAAANEDKAADVRAAYPAPAQHLSADRIREVNKKLKVILKAQAARKAESSPRSREDGFVPTFASMEDNNDETP